MKGQVRFANKGEYVDENVALFTDAVSVVPKREDDSCGTTELIRPLAFLAKMWRKYA